MVDHVMKSGKEFEIWVNGNMVLSDWMNGLGLKFVEKLFVISQFKQKSVYRAIEMLLKEEFGKMGVFEELGEWQKGDLSRLAFTL